MAAIARVRNWRRGGSASSSTGDRDGDASGEGLPPELVDAYRREHPGRDLALIARAYRLASAAHQGQFRRSGEPYIVHPVAVATILADLGLDDVTVAAALLHDAVEDTWATVESVKADFGTEVAAIVDGVTKLDGIHFDTKEAQQAATMRKMLVAMAADIRVLLIKLADRLHNLRTVAIMPIASQHRTAQETLDFYAPLAHRLGLAKIKAQLEDLSFATLYPKQYAEIEQMVSTRAPERDIYLTQVIDLVQVRMADIQVVADVTGRPKTYWSIYEKMMTKRCAFDDIYDLQGIRVLVGDAKDCYAALGAIHAMWRSLERRFKDYISNPKYNLYQSLHTTVIGPGGKLIEVQIRTWEMHHRAEFGIAAHWSYKKGGSSARTPIETAWLQRIVEWQHETADPVEFMANLKGDLHRDEVILFTPKGKVITLRVGATPVDFAYAIHTDIGHHCIGAKVNGRLVALDSILPSGASVEIFTSKIDGAGPSLEWLSFVVTPKARNHIRQWFSRSRRGEAIEHGREEFIRFIRQEGVPPQRLVPSVLARAAESIGYTDIEHVYAAIGEGQLSVRTVVEKVVADLAAADARSSSHGSSRRRRPRPSGGVLVEGASGVLVHLARCCTPVPGDPIVGFETTGRGVSVHRADCANENVLADQMVERHTAVEWNTGFVGPFVVTIEVEALDRIRLLQDVGKSLADHHLNVLSSETVTGSDQIARMRLDFELGDTSLLPSVLDTMKSIDGVCDVRRVLPGVDH